MKIRRWQRHGRALWYAVAGAVLSVGAPTGLLIVRELYAPRPVAIELASERLTYLYVLLLTAVVLAGVGFVLGRQADRLAALSETDALTGMPNRRALERHLDEEYRRSLRYRTSVSLLMIDVDGLKQVNDSAGHEAGDRLIRRVAAAIGQELRSSDFAARWGGDEFAIVALNTDREAAHASAERLLAAVRRQSPAGVSEPATVSVGVATLDPDSDPYADIDAFVRAADAALYRAKEDGRNCVRSASPLHTGRPATPRVQREG
jgi:diguanylate cyclase (GGDEF)-like protein